MSADIDAELAQALKRRKLFKELIEHPAWKELLTIGQAQVNTQLDSLLMSPEENLDGHADVLRTYYRKGTIYGINLILRTPSGTIALTDDLASNRQPKEHEDAERRSEQPNLPFDDEHPDAIVTELG